MKASVVIATFNRRALLEEVLGRLFDQDFDSAHFEVIVVVDGSSDGTLEMLASLRPSCSFRYFAQQNAGQAAARNRGVSQAKGDIVIFLDDDILVPRDFVSRHVTAHLQHQSVVAFGAVSISPRSRRNIATEFTKRFSEAHYGALESGGQPNFPNHVHVLPNSSVPRSDLAAVGGFDPSFFRAHEDTELGLRLKERGLTWKFLSGLRCDQVFDKATSTVAFEEPKLDARAELQLVEKHPAYRPHSALVPLRGWRHLLQRAAVRVPISPDWAFRPLLSACDALSGSVLARDLGVRLVRYCRRAVLEREALRIAGGWQTFEQRFWKRVPVLMYHHVGVRADFGDLTVTPIQFASQMSWLKSNGYNSISLDQWDEWRVAGKPLPHKPVMITFDDGFAELSEHAYPVLQKNGFSAVTFIVTGEIGGVNRWDAAKGYASAPLLSGADISLWAQRGMEFGSHTSSHASLPACSGHQLHREIVGSANALADLTGKRPTAFAYPFGDHDERSRQVVAENYREAFGIVPSMNSLGTDPHLLHRIMIRKGDGLRSFAGLIAGRWTFRRVTRRIGETLRARPTGADAHRSANGAPLISRKSS